MDGLPRSRLVVALLVGGLVGFSAGYFAGGGGRPAGRPRDSSNASQGGRGGRTAALEEKVARDPENPTLLIQLGNLRYDREDWEGAIKAYEKARRKAPKNANLLSDLGAAHRNAGEFELAAAFFGKAIDADSQHWQALLNWVLLEAFDRRNPKEAERLFDQLKAKYPEIPQLDRIQSQISSLRSGA